MRRKVTGRIPSSWQWACQGRIRCLPRLHWSAPLVSIYAALTGRTPNRYGRAHSQAAPGALPVSMQATWLGALPVLRCCLPVATSVDVTHVTSQFYKLTQCNVCGAVAHKYLFFFSVPGLRVLLRRPIQALHKTGEELSFTARCLLSFCDIGKWSCDQRDTFDRIFLAVSCHRAPLKRRYLDSTTSNLENWVIFFPEKGVGWTENERQKWRVDQCCIYAHTWSEAARWSHTGVDGAAELCPWGRWPACVPSTQYPMYTASCKKSWSIDKLWKSVSWPFFTRFGQMTPHSFSLELQKKKQKWK